MLRANLGVGHDNAAGVLAGVARPRSPNPLRWVVLRQFLQTPPDRARRHAGCHRHRGNATITCRKCLRRRDQTTAPFVEKRRYRGKPLPDGFNIDHHHNIWYDLSVVDPYFTLSKVDSIISGQVPRLLKRLLWASLTGGTTTVMMIASSKPSRQL